MRAAAVTAAVALALTAVAVEAVPTVALDSLNADTITLGPRAARPAAVVDALVRARVQRRLQKQTKLTSKQLLTLYSLLDNDGNGKLNNHELIDLFDGINNDALLIDDCNNNPSPHHWLGDGYCDDGHTQAKGKGNFNCDIFLCDNGDCGKTCRQVKGRAQVEVRANGPPIYGHIMSARGQSFECDLVKGKTYYFWTSIGGSKGHIQDTIMTLYGSDGKSVLKKNDDGPQGKQNSYFSFTPAASIKDATILITPKSRKDRGSFEMTLRTTKPRWLTEWSETKAKCPTACGLSASAPANPQQCKTSDKTKQPDSACIKQGLAKPRTTTKCPATKPCKCYDDNKYLAKTGINCAAAKTIVGCTHDMSKTFPGKVPKGSIVSKICVKACFTCKGNLCNSKNQCISAGQGR